MATNYIPASRARITYCVSNSRFIATADRAASVDDAKAFLKEIRDEMPDANHHVYAYCIGHDKSLTEGMSDDGEPSGTAGPPALAVVRGSGVGDIVLVITRYFGGTKLGTGGLVSAYKNSAKMAMEELKTEEKIERVAFTLDVPYVSHKNVCYVLNTYKGRIKEENFGASIEMKCDIPIENLSTFKDAVLNRSSGSILLTMI